MSDLAILQAAPSFEARQEVVPVPELGGAVIVRGLLASEAFALQAMRQTALRPIHAARHEHQTMVRERRAAHDERARTLPAGVQAPEFVAPDFTPPELGFVELRQYAAYTTQLLELAVVNPAGLALYTAREWEVVGQHHHHLLPRLQAVAERLSGLDTEDVQKN